MSAISNTAGMPAWYTTGRPPLSALVLFYLAYLIAAGFGRWMMVIPAIPITFWPPNGVILALLLAHPRNTWPWWIALGAAGELTGNLLWFMNPIVWAIGYVAANAIAIIFAALLLAPHIHAPCRRMDTVPQMLAFLAIAVLATPVISATLGSTISAIVGKNTFFTAWPVWWLGDATGFLIATPLMLSVINIWRERVLPTTAQVLEGAAIALILAGLGAWELATGAAYAFLLLLPVFWAALRFEFRGVSFAVVILTILIGLHSQSLASGQVAAEAIFQSHIRLQALLVAAASTGLIVAAMSRQQRQALYDLYRANNELEERVLERTRAIEEAEQRFRATFQNAGVGIGIVSGDGVLMRVNNSLAKMLGYGVEELEGRTLDEFTFPEDRARGEAALAMLNSGAANEYDIEKRYVGKDGEIVWGHTTVSCVRRENGAIAYLIKIIQNITPRKQSDEARDLLMREVNHRSKNLLSIVQAIARQTARQSPQEFLQTFGRRLQALSDNQDLLVHSGWTSVQLSDLVSSQLGHFGEIGGRILLSGQPIKVCPTSAQAIGMALHELATNALKYGSLSNETGRIEVTWTVEGETFRMNWRETGGPVIMKPGSGGFGTTVLEAMTATALCGEVSIHYAPEGLQWELRCPLSVLRQGPEKHPEKRGN